MASVKIVLRKKKNKDGTYPLAIRITKDRVSSYVHLGHHIEESFWDAKNRRVKKSHPNSVRLNNLLSKKLAEAEDNLLDMEVAKNDSSSKAIKSRIRTAKESAFFTQADIYLENLKKLGKYNRHKSDQSTQELLKYRAYLKGSKNLSDQTVVNYLTIIQTLFNQAIKNGIVDQKYYPFGRDKIVMKAPRSMKIGLMPEEVKRIEEVDLPLDSYANHARNLWLTAFYFAGMRVSDVLRLKWSDFENNRLYYAMGKNAKGGSLKISEKAELILAHYRNRNSSSDLVFPDLETVVDLSNKYAVQLRISGVIQKLNGALKDFATAAKVTKKLTMHIARHTFGNISGDKIPIQMLQKLYRHSSISTTIGYQANFIHKDADEALDAVIGF